METIKFIVEDGSMVDFYVEDQTRVNGINYLLVTDSQEDEAVALILKDISDESQAEATYVIVEDDTELEAVAKIFEETMEVQIEKE
ncbi:MAG: DUF1292 domain-containing protein [Lachnospiraceae bacterium]|nr:DUF1292 domain-containing protein [Lachnospiraceae bacterium]MDD3616464.1 DUF1292 domain-containing protein [Lachnospiraceae bacterium]